MRLNITCIIIIAVSLFTFRSNGQDNYLDTSFGTNGIAITEKFEPNTMYIQQDGKMVVGGAISRPTQIGPSTVNTLDYVVYRFNTDGTADTSFGTAGKFVEGGFGTQRIVDAEELPNGKILLLGQSHTSMMASQSSYFVFIRLNADGTKDTSFGNNGSITHHVNDVDTPTKMIVLPDQKVIAIGGAKTSSNPTDDIQPPTRPLIARYNADLTPDTSFNGTGYRVITSHMASFRHLAIDSNGDIVTGFDNVLFKFNAIGQVVTGFGNNGILALPPANGSFKINEVNIIADSKLIASGSVNQNNGSVMLARFIQDGTFDSAYGTLGKFILENGSGQSETAMQSIITENIIISGVQRRGVGQDFGLLLTTQEGALINDQIITLSAGDQRLKCIARQQDGKIVAAGYDDNNMIMMRYDISEFLDAPSFSSPAISLYPNPATDHVTVTGLPEGTAISLYNISGQKLLEVTAKGDTTIDISSLPQGMYFLDTAKGSAKIIKK